MIRSRVLCFGVVLLASSAAIEVSAPSTGAAPSPPAAPSPSADSRPQVALDPLRGLPGTAVQVIPQAAPASDCSAAWDSDSAVTFFCGRHANGQLGSTTLTVPAAATPGTHYITVCRPGCDHPRPVWQVAVPFTVSTIVPDLATLSVGEARSVLENAELVLGGVTGSTNDPGARVAFQSPQGFSVVDPGSAVNVEVAGAAPPPTTPAAGGGTGQLPLSGGRAPSGSPVAADVPSTARSWHPMLIVAILTGTGLLVALVAAEAAVRRNRKRRLRTHRLRRPQVYLRAGRGAHLVTIRDTGRSATHTVAIASHRQFTVTSGKELR